jgi:septal ring factor EnvC (AmiA/AmiB activator)
MKITAGLLLLIPCLHWTLRNVHANEIGVVTALNLNVRSGPDRTAPSIEVLQRGTRIKILKRHPAGWLEIEQNGGTGFIRDRRQYIRIESGEERSPHAGDDGKIESVKKESENILQEIEKRQVEVKAFAREEMTLIDGLDEIDIRLSEAHKKAGQFRSELAALEVRIDETTENARTLLKNIEASQPYISKRICALYKMHMLGKMQILASTDSMYDFFIRRSALERILAHDEAVQKSLLEGKRLLSDLLEKLNRQKAEKIVYQEGYDHQIAFMSREREKRRRLLSEIQGRRSLELAAIESLKQAAKALESALMSLNSEKEVLPAGKKKTLQNSFSALKGNLVMPVNGEVVSRFGSYQSPEHNLKGFQNGIYIKADRGEPIHAVSGGTVVFSDWFKGYGNLIIIDHGSGYFTVYAHALELFKGKGDPVEANEVIATVGDSGSMAGARLYFEVRHRGKAIDPLAWIRHG